MSFSSIQDFRDRATDQDRVDLEAFILAQPKKVEAFPNDTYGFSYSSAANYLREKGYLGGKKEKSEKEETPEFIIRGGERKEFVSRSFSMQKDILDRLDKLSQENWQYSKKAILNKLLDEALAKYGY